jgi:hypothetical protein
MAGQKWNNLQWPLKLPLHSYFPSFTLAAQHLSLHSTKLPLTSRPPRPAKNTQNTKNVSHLEIHPLHALDSLV